MATSNTPARRRPGRRTGRPTKLTPEVREKIVSAVRAGNYLETAAQYAGVHPTTVFRWLRDGEQEGASRTLRDFCYAVHSARAEAEVRVVGQVQRVIMGGQVLRETSRRLPDGTEETERSYSQPDGRVALDFLSRAFPDRWARRAALEVTGADGGPVQVHAHVIDSLAERVHALAEEHGGEVVEAQVIDDPPS